MALRTVGTQTALAGPWQVEVAVRRRGVEDVTTGFQWSVAPPPPAVLVSDRRLEPVLIPIAWVGLAAVLFIAGAAWLRGERSARQRARGETAKRRSPDNHKPWDFDGNLTKCSWAKVDNGCASL